MLSRSSEDLLNLRKRRCSTRPFVSGRIQSRFCYTPSARPRYREERKKERRDREKEVLVLVVEVTRVPAQELFQQIPTLVSGSAWEKERKKKKEGTHFSKRNLKGPSFPQQSPLTPLPLRTCIGQSTESKKRQVCIPLYRQMMWTSWKTLRLSNKKSTLEALRNKSNRDTRKPGTPPPPRPSRAALLSTKAPDRTQSVSRFFFFFFLLLLHQSILVDSKLPRHTKWRLDESARRSRKKTDSARAWYFQI